MPGLGTTPDESGLKSPSGGAVHSPGIYARAEVGVATGCLSETGFQISQLSLQGEDLVPSEAEEELDPGLGSQLRSQTGRQPAQLIELDGCQHLNLTGERGLIC